MASYGDRPAQSIDAGVEVGLLMQTRGLSREDATRIVLRARELAAQRALERANTIAADEAAMTSRGIHPKAARALSATGSEMNRRQESQAPVGRHEFAPGATTSANIYATPYEQPRQDGSYPVGEDPITRGIQDEADRWAVPERHGFVGRQDDPIEDNQIRRALMARRNGTAV